MHGPDAAAVQPVGPVGRLVLDVGGGEDRPLALGKRLALQSPLDASLHSAKPHFDLAETASSGSTIAHSKCLLADGGYGSGNNLVSHRNGGISSFFRSNCENCH